MEVIREQLIKEESKEKEKTDRAQKDEEQVKL
jgi:hypothetical protein